MTRAVICATSVLCPAGRGVEQVWATVRCGISRLVNSHVMDQGAEPVRMGLVPEDALERPSAEFDALPLPSRGRRMLRLGAPALRALATELDGRSCVLYLGLPDIAVDDAPWMSDFPALLAAQAGVTLDADASRAYAYGRAAALLALQGALNAIAEDPARQIVVGGVDSFLDLALLARLSEEGRILGPNAMDGFLPGEGAAFIVLRGTPARADTPSVAVCGAASVADPGHRFGAEPARGEGLSDAIEAMRREFGDPRQPIATTFAGMNGESFDAKLWGVAHVRHSTVFAPAVSVEHPADCIGDTGAASGAILASLAAHALARSQRPAPALVWAASDRETRACALLEREDA
jgi:3-oxoacyl-[acyl-carrier-protein] synthase-1